MPVEPPGVYCVVRAEGRRRAGASPPRGETRVEETTIGTPRRLALLTAALLVCAATSPEAWPRRHHRLTRLREARPWSLRPHVVAPDTIRVHDGDTFYSGPETIRLRGIDTPELGQPGAAEAKWRLIQLLHSGPVLIVPRAEDVYGRTVADVWVGRVNVADVLRQEGFEKPFAPLGFRRQ